MELPFERDHRVIRAGRFLRGVKVRAHGFADEDGGVRRLMLLNTDWTTAGNRKTVCIDTGDVHFETDVVEREAKILTVLPGVVLEPDSCELHLEVAESGAIRCHGTGRHSITLHRPNGVCETVSVDLTRNTVATAGLA